MPPFQDHGPLIQFLQRDLSVSDEAITLALKHPDREIAPLPMILWQYGLISIEQLNQIFDWLLD